MAINMAAAMKNICGFSCSMYFKAVSNAHSLFPVCKNRQTVSLFRACWKCTRSIVESTERKTSVTSISHRGRSLELALAASDCCGTAATRTRKSTYLSPSPWPTVISPSHRLLSLDSLQAFSLGYVGHCRAFCTQNTLFQTESKKTAADETGNTASRDPIQYTNQKREAGDNADPHNSNVKSEKKENIKTIPNLLTTLRMASSPVLGYLVLCENYGLALGLFAVAGFTDMLDGYIARNFANQTSALGSALDPLADKLLVTILTISMTSVGLIPLPLTALIVSRDVCLITGGFYIRYRSLSPPVSLLVFMLVSLFLFALSADRSCCFDKITLSRYFDFSHATVSVTPTFISKMNTTLQLFLVAFSLAAPVFGFVDHVCLQALWYSTGATTFLSGLDYMWSWKKYVRLLEKDQSAL